MSLSPPSGSENPSLSAHLQHLGGFFSELADHPHGHLLPLLHAKGMALLAIDAAEGLDINFHLQCLLGFLLRSCLREVAQPFLPFLKFVFVAASEEDLAHHDV